jgi:hypothetical protein
MAALVNESKAYKETDSKFKAVLDQVLQAINAALQKNAEISRTYNIEKVLNFAEGDINIQNQTINF